MHTGCFFCLDGLKLFSEEGIFNYSTMLMRDDLGVLLLGAREAIYALDIDNISVRKAVVRTCAEIHKKKCLQNVQLWHSVLISDVCLKLL